jgi:hypothetical protein
MFVLAFELTSAVVPSMLAGTIFTFASQRFAHLQHIELLWSCWMPLSLWALFRLMKNGRLLDGALLGAFVAFQGLSSLYYLVFLGTYLVVAALGSIDRAPFDLWKRRLAGFGLAAVVAAILIGPYIVIYSQMRTGRVPRNPEMVARYSASLQTYARVAPENRLYSFLRRSNDASERSLFPGAVALALAAVGIWKGPRRQVVVCVAGLIFALVMSVGVNGWLFPLLQAWIPPLQDIRAPARYAILVLMSIAVLAALGASTWRAGRSRPGVLVTAGLFTVVLLEYASMPIVAIKTVVEPPQIARWLADKPKGSVTVMLPMHHLKYDPFFAFLSIYHWQPILNGYSSFAPRDYRSTVAALSTFPDASSVQRLRERKVSYVVLSAKDYGEPRYSEIKQALRDHADFQEPVIFDDPDFPCAVFPLRP